MEKNYIAVDIETTGLSPIKDKIIEIGALKVIEGEVVERFSELIDPQIPLPERIIEITNITDDMLVGKPTIDEVMPRFLAFSGELPVLGHNILFDYSFLKTAAQRIGAEYERKGIDTLYISRALHEEFESKSLGTMCDHYGIVNENHHRAYDDAFAAMKLYEELAKHPKSTEAMLTSKDLWYKPKKIQPATAKQKNYLLSLIKYHKIVNRQSIDTMSKSEASRLIDQILSQYGRSQIEK